MFTGLVERVGVVEAWRQEGARRSLAIRHGPWESPLADGESVCVQGVCLTVASKAEGLMCFDVLDETRSRSSLGSLRPGDEVNLERALRADGRLGGHFVTGHIDGTGSVAECRTEGADVVLSVACAPSLLAMMVSKGSVACDGVSLTIASLTRVSFTVHLVPYTLKSSNLGRARRGHPVNIEADILGKYVAASLRGSEGRGELTLEALRKAGFGLD